MKKNKRGAITATQMFIGIAVLVLGLGAILLVAPQLTGIGGQDVEIITRQGESQFSSYDVEFNFIARDGSTAQDAEADLDIDIFEWNPDKNEQLAGRTSSPKHLLDCAGVVPAHFDGTDTTITIVEENLCVVNVYKFWQTLTAGDSETTVDDVLTLTKADMDDVDGSGTMETKLDNSKVYLVTVTEGADSDEDDVIPIAFLIDAAPTTKLDTGELANGNINIRFEYSYYSDALAAGKFKVSGDCIDDEDNSPNLDSSLDGAIDSSLTSATTIKLDCVVEVEITKDGYAVILENPLASSAVEKPYLRVTPYGESNDDDWILYGTGNLTGDVGFSTANVAADQILWESMTACGVVISDDSTTDAVKFGNEKLRDLSCLHNIYDKGGAIQIPISIVEVKVDWDLSTSGSDEIVSANSGSSPESFANITLIGLESTTLDLVNQDLSG